MSEKMSFYLNLSASQESNIGAGESPPNQTTNAQAPTDIEKAK